MMWTGRRRQEALARATERREREDSSPRLRDETPELESLELEFTESRPGAPDVSHIRRVVVPVAAALFDVACGDRKCVGGGHDVTDEILSALKRGDTAFSGEHPCQGTVGETACPRVLRFSALAKYH